MLVDYKAFTMKTRILIATILIFLGALIHIIGGELTDIAALLKKNLPLNIQIEIRAIWYLVAIDFIVSAGYLIYLVLKEQYSEHKMLVQFIGIRMFLYGIAFLLLILLTYPRYLLHAPQWILLVLIGILLLWDLFFRPKSDQSNELS